VSGIFGRIFDFDIDHHAPTDGQDFSQQGNVGRELAYGQIGDGTEVFHLGIVMDGQGPIGREPDVELYPVGSETACFRERSQGVLSETLRTSPVGEYCRHAGTFPWSEAIFVLLVQKITKALASTVMTYYPLLVNPFSMTDTDLGSNM
jgi:hypothetical protein